jgi:hypothetical protein
MNSVISSGILRPFHRAYNYKLRGVLQTYVSAEVDKAQCRAQGGNNSQGPTYRVPVSDGHFNHFPLYLLPREREEEEGEEEKYTSVPAA